MREVGRVELVCRYPFKSMAGEDLNKGFLAYTGMLGDRVYALVRQTENPNFPWLTARQRPELLLYKARFLRELVPERQYPSLDEYAVSVEDAEGVTSIADDANWLAFLREKLGCSFALRFSERGMQDARPISLISYGTISCLEGEIGFSLDLRRFRANLYIRWLDSPPFFEDSLVGKELQVGEKTRLLVSKRDPRCKIISLDPNTASETPSVLAAVTKQHDNCAGVYAVVLREGYVSPDDAVYLVEE